MIKVYIYSSTTTLDNSKICNVSMIFRKPILILIMVYFELYVFIISELSIIEHISTSDASQNAFSEMVMYVRKTYNVLYKKVNNKDRHSI